MNIEKYISESGKVLSQKLSAMTEFEKTEIYEHTKFLECSPSMSQRIRAIKEGLTYHPVCGCGEYLNYNKSVGILFNSPYCSFECSMKGVDRSASKIKFSNTIKQRKESVSDHIKFSYDEIKNIITSAKDSFIDQYSITAFLKENPDIRTAILLYHKDMKKLSEKVCAFYMPHTCKECGCVTSFLNISKGFSQYCKEHGTLLSAETKRNKSVENASKILSENGYIVTNVPDGLNNGKFEAICEFGHPFSVSLRNGAVFDDFGMKTLCTTCHPNKNISRPEREIAAFIESLGFTVVKQHPIGKNKNGVYTIDIFVPEKNLGIEHDGLMFHSFGVSKHSMFNNADAENKNGHLNKTDMCEKQGISLLHIFSNEWSRKRSVWESVIRSKLGCTDKIHARKCTIQEVEHFDAEMFLNRNHLQGSINSKYRYGLFFDGELVSLMTVGSSRFSKFDLEIHRFASKLNFTVVGGFQKILSHIKKIHSASTIVSYANRRWSTGNLYKKANFKLENLSPPNYFYFQPKNEVLYSRMSFQKHKLDSSKGNTESEIMFNTGYRRIWDCGNLVFSLNT